MPRLLLHRLRRILLAVLLLLLALVLLLAGSVLVDGMVGQQRLEAVTNQVIPGLAGPDVRAYVARPAAAGPHPAVIMIHEFWGLNADITAKAELLAQEGYVVVAPDTFRGSTTRWIPRAIYQVISHPAAQVNVDLDAVFAWLASQSDVQPERIAIMGFCYGGRASLNFSLTNPDLAATAIFYGSPVTDSDQLASLPGPVLGIFGEADTSIPLAEVEAFEAALNAAGVPNQITIYDDQPHAFVQSVEGIRAGGAQGQAWAELLAFLKQTLQSPNTSHHTMPTTGDHSLSWRYLARLALSHLGTNHADGQH